MYEIEHNKDLEIKKVPMNVDNLLAEDLVSPLPEKSFCMLICGPPGSGKSNLAINLLTRGKKNSKRRGYKKVFNHVFVVSPSLASMQEDVFKNHPEEKMAEQFNAEWMDAFEEHLHYASEQGETTICLMDDVAAELKRSSDLQKRLARCVNNRRHKRLSLIIIAQYYIDIPKNIRSNCNYLALFRSVNKQQLEQVYQEVLPFEKQELIPFTSWVWDTRFSFLFVDMSLSKSGKFLYYKNFDLIRNM